MIIFCPLRDPGTDIDTLVLFELYFNGDVVKRIIESILAYAEKKNDLRDWYCKFIKKTFIKTEFFSYIGVLILLGLHGARNHR